MIDTEFTLTSPLSGTAHGQRPLLGLTIVWHPDHSRIGEQYAGTAGAGSVELNRYLPLFCRPGGDGLGLGHGGISRDPVRIVRDEHDGLLIQAPASRMVVELNGAVVGDPVRLSAEQIDCGQMLGLGRSVLVCVHWMRALPKHNPVPGLMGVSSAAITVREQIRLVASTLLPVLLLGETGTGKEIVARAIHALGERAGRPLVTVNMAALNESLAAADLFGATRGAYTGAQLARKGLFAEADGATLFLDEIGNTPASVQPMLLRVLEGGQYRPLGAHSDSHSSARLIAATDQHLGSETFNQALLRRLESFVIRLPPLRTRREDIGVLIVHLLGLGTATAPLASLPYALVSCLASYHWPGNIRQLSHVLTRAALSMAAGDTPTFATLIEAEPVRVGSSEATSAAPAAGSVAAAAPDSPAAAPARPRKRPSELGEQEILRAMEDAGWTIQAAAQALGISRPTMYKLIEEHAQIRRAEQIPEAELRRAFAACAGNLARCASLLKTPSEALRRQMQLLGLSG